MVNEYYHKYKSPVIPYYRETYKVESVKSSRDEVETITEMMVSGKARL